MRGSFSTRRLAATVVATLALSGISASVAGARPWTATYDWQGQASTGYENWTVNEQPAPGGPGPWYQASLGGASQGRGLVIAPTGGRLYDNGNPSSQLGGPATILRWQVPGASTITRGVFSTLRYRNEDDDQYLRVRIFGGPGADARKDFGPAYGQTDPATTYTLPTTTLTPTGPGTTVEAWLFTVCHPNPPGSGVYACPNIPADTGTFSRVGSVELTLDDPDQPTVDVASSPPITDGWTNKRRPQKLTTTATDPSSGIQRIQTQLRLGTSTRTLGDTTITCDPLHRTSGRNGLVCPSTASASATDRATDSATKDRTYIVTAWDYAGNQTTKTLVVRRDITKPNSGSIGGQLNSVSRKWTNRRDTIPVTVRASDSHSGVGRVALSAQRVGSGRTIDLGTATPPCDRGCKTVSSAVPVDLSRLDRDGRYRLKLQVIDRAGNLRSFTVGPQIKIDRTAPRPIGPGPTYTVRNDGSVRVLFTPSRDPQPGSGRIRLYMVRYYPAPTADAPLAPAAARFARIRVASARAATAKENRFRKSRSRAITFRTAKDGIDTDRPVALVELDDTSGAFAPPEQVDGEQSVPRERQATLRSTETKVDAYKAQNWDEFYKYLRQAEAAKNAPVLKTALKAGLKRLSAGAVGAVVGSLVFPDSLGCSSVPVPTAPNGRAKTYSAALRNLIRETRRARPGQTTVARRWYGGARGNKRELELITVKTLDVYRGSAKKCRVFAEVAREMLQHTTPLLNSIDARLDQLEREWRRELRYRRQAKRKQVPVALWKARVQQSQCHETANSADGGGRFYAYYVKAVPSPSVTSGVIYVGISSQKGNRRCRQHVRDVKKFPIRKYPRLFLYKYYLGKLVSRDQIEGVEQVLIDHYGRTNPAYNYNFDLRRRARRPGTLLNKLDGYRNVANSKIGYCLARQRGTAAFRASGKRAYDLYWRNLPGFARWNC
ncbi:hypothetical protein PAI11_25840 [Patulibacter medicamentivorans]|uniref:GIY-YIG domain-containing protein n=2 Tax=Patulibacter medicamentivorans TaxID=1097667 RepID=H0E6Y3_9ACTN|nr:hypothetical protein PAI11_25840 [Patulibacter medicamentivorans]